MIYGYARSSDFSLELDLQISLLIEFGVDEMNIYFDSTTSESKSNRIKLDMLVSKLKKGDTLVTCKIDRIAKNVSHFLKVMVHFQENGIEFISIQEPFINTTLSNGKLLYTLFDTLAQLERNIIIERTLMGQERARKEGIHMGRKPGLTKVAKKKAKLAAEYYRDVSKGLSIKEIMLLIDIKSKPTLYSYLAHEGRRNCKICRKLFWDKTQELDNAYCKNHIKEKKKHQNNSSN